MIPEKNSLFKSHIFIVVFVIMLSFTIWWITLNPFNPTDQSENARNLFGGTYQIMAYLGGISGLIIAKKWGGIKSLIGSAVTVFSIGLLCQGFGQSVYTYYLFHSNIAAPYPSLGDLGYFGTIPFYIYGAFLLSKVSGAKISLRSYGHKIQALIIPTIMLLVSYFLFLQDYTFDFSAPLKTFLDFGYPLGQAIYVSLAILAFTLSRKFLGGIMRKPILFLIAALVLQYLCDYIFLYQFNAGNWYVGGINDYMYLFSYFLMTISLIKMSVTFDNIKES